MKLKSEIVHIDGEDYEVNELSLRQMQPIMELAQKEGSLVEQQARMIEACVKHGGKNVEGVMDWPARIANKLAPICMRLNGMSGEDEEGNG